MDTKSKFIRFIQSEAFHNLTIFVGFCGIGIALIGTLL